MHGWLWQALRRTPARDLDLAAECSAYLAGDYRVFALRNGMPPAAWHWINAPAHGSLEDVASCARRACGSEGRFEWPDCEAFVAAEALGACHGDRSALLELQQTSLIPLELAVMRRHQLVPARLATIS